MPKKDQRRTSVYVRTLKRLNRNVRTLTVERNDARFRLGQLRLQESHLQR